MSLRRLDARFALPRHPRSARVLGDLEPWRSGLEQLEVELARPGRPADLVVAPAGLARAAYAADPALLILEGRLRDPAPTARGWRLRRLVARPSLGEPSILLPLDAPGAAAYAVRAWSRADRRWRRWRRDATAALLERDRFPARFALLATASRETDVPWLLEAAGLPADASWALSLGQGDTLSRNVFHVLPAGAAAPAWVVKFARVPGQAESFERDERGLELARRAGGAAARHAPRLLRRFTAEGISASIESAAAGRRLRDVLEEPGALERKLALVDRVSEWSLSVARDTAGPPEALAPELHRLLVDVVPRWRALGARDDLVTGLGPLPAVLQHNDLGSWNVVVGPAGHTAVDWESARGQGLPLWDLLYFLADALAVIDGAVDGPSRHLHTGRLFRGELRSSAVLFRWVRRAVATTGIPAEAVGRLTTLCWLHHALSPEARRDAARRAGVPSSRQLHGTERNAELWLNDPALGPEWSSWRSGG